MAGLQAPRGMRDILPDEAAAFDALHAVIAARATRYGYPRIDTPVVEDRVVFQKGAGEGSDIVQHEMYDVALHGTGGLVLRPEGTAAVVRAYLEHGLHRAPQPVRLFYWEAMFRGQRPQLLRYRQFWQWGLECIGAEDAGADLEQIDYTNGLFRELGLTEYVLKVNTIGESAVQAKMRDALRGYFERYRAELSEDSQRRIDANVLRVFDSKVPRDREIAEGAPKLRDLVSDADRAHFDQITSGLDRLGIAYEVDERLARGLDYYRRTVFEFILTNPEYTKAGEIAVAAGGRYDGLVKTMGGPDVPAVGIAGGIDVLYAALRTQGVTVAKEEQADVYVLSAQRNDVADRLVLASGLRAKGFSVAIDYSDRSLDKQLEGAVKHGAKVAVIRPTEEEARGGYVVVRDLVKREDVKKRLAALITEVGRHVTPQPIPTLWTPPADPGDKEPGAAGEAPFLADPRD
ncbi:MAG TPA: histidine--tRNA ligase [Candidatus Acidoferrales bacterium]|nr:histidine--tRNA ligase [Candidatus Acidoferrales bacterium]